MNMSYKEIITAKKYRYDLHFRFYSLIYEYQTTSKPVKYWCMMYVVK